MKNKNTERGLFLFQRLPYGKFLTSSVVFIEIIAGVLFILGLYTQIAALIGMLYSLNFILLQRNPLDSFIQNRVVYILIFFASFSLFITGAGAFAFDLPV